MPIQRAVALLGTEEERYAGAEAGFVHRAWSISAWYISIEADAVGSITSMTATGNGEDPKLLLSLPDGLLLGRTTMEDVIKRRGQPYDTESSTAEASTFYSYIYRTGPEGSIYLRYTHRADVTSPSDPGGFNAMLLPKLVTSFTVE